VFKHYNAGGTAGEAPGGPFDIVTPTAEDSAGVPTGTWAVTLVSFTGQTWKVPNEIAAFGLPALDSELDQAGQGAPLEIEP
jgi:hypothetical protein